MNTNKIQTEHKGIKTYEMILKEEMAKSTFPVPDKNQKITENSSKVAPNQEKRFFQSQFNTPIQKQQQQKIFITTETPGKQNFNVINQSQSNPKFSSLNEYFFYQQSQHSLSINSQNGSGQVGSTFKGENPLKFDVYEKLGSQKTVYSGPMIGSKNNSQFEQFNAKPVLRVSQDEFAPKTVKTTRFVDQNLNSSFYQDQQILESLASSNNFKTIHNEFTELSSKNIDKKTLHTHNSPTVIHVSNDFERLDLQNSSMLRQNRYDLIVSQEKFLNSTLKNDFDISRNDDIAPKVIPKSTIAKPISREVIPENPYKKSQESILKNLEKSQSFSNKSLEISSNYAYNGYRPKESLQRKNVDERTADEYSRPKNKINDNQSIKNSKTLKEKEKSNQIYLKEERKTDENGILKNQSQKIHEFDQNSDSISDILRNIVLLFFKIIEIIFSNFSDLFDKLIKDSNNSTSNPNGFVDLRLPLSICFSMPQSSYDSAKKIATTAIIFMLYKYLVK